MSWVKSTGLSFARQLSRSLDLRNNYEPQAYYNSFCKHWQQAHDIILKSQPRHLHDDVLGVVNHLEQLTTILVLEARVREINASNNPAACLEYLLSENLLDKLYEWTICTGKYENAVRLEQLKLFNSLVYYYRTQVIAAEPFLRPLLKLLSGFRNELLPPNLETQLVIVLNQLCVALMQDMKFIDLFFLTTHTHKGSQAEFIIVRLLLSSVHCEGSMGSAARDALLLCAKMSARCPQLADFMLSGNTCPVLATGLSGLYSLLPRTLNDKIFCLSSDDVNHVHKLTLFLNSLEFCNAVAEVAHPFIKKHLLDLLYQGFLVPVMGPALLQTRGGPLQSGAAEQAAAMAYLELIVRHVTKPGLLRAVLHFLFIYEYDGVRIIDVLLRRLEGTSQLSLVSLALMETLIDLNCEDVMLDLVFKHVLNGHHLMVAYRHKISDPEPYRDAAVAFLSLSPRCCARPIEKTRQWVEELALSGRRVLDFKREDERRVNGVHDDIAMCNLFHEVSFNYGNTNETVFGNYHAYLCDSRFQIVSRMLSCISWSSKYDNISPPKREPNNNTKEKETDQTPPKEQDSLISCTSGYETKTSDTPEKEQHSLIALNEQNDKSELNEGKDQNSPMSVNGHLNSSERIDGNTQYNLTPMNEHINKSELNEGKDHHSLTSLNEQVDKIEPVEGKEHDSLTSTGESSGYESFKYKDGEEEAFAEEVFRRSFAKGELHEYDEEVPLVRSWTASAESIIGPLLSNLLKKTASLLKSDLVTNCRVTSVISKLASLPTPLLMSLLLYPGVVLQPNVPSLFQILSKLKEEVDCVTEATDKSGELVDKARVFLIQREMALVKSRGPNNDDSQVYNSSPAHKQEDTPFRRVESKRRSLSNSFPSIFGRRKSSSSPSQQNTHSQYNASYSSPQKQLIFTQEAYWDQSITHRSILNAIILDEWLKELSALCEEHALRLSSENCLDDTYVQSVAL